MTETTRYICIHGHFYQPPRENPWLEEIETQESAHPFHDWNDRIHEECYAPNARARILDSEGWLVRICNNYELISFDFGPTLLTWMERHEPETYHEILKADEVSRTHRSGHGNAIAQAYNHMIMPLASTRDKHTQIVWGIEDFHKRFRRDPEGMWLPETAVDKETLELLVGYGIVFTVLAPRQAARFRLSEEERWHEVNSGSIDPSRPYRCLLPGGKSIVLFFYDGPISQAIAYENLLRNGDDLKQRLLGAFSDKRNWTQLVHIATDGESYGHHHRFGEMALAYALEHLKSEPGVRLTNYGEFLGLFPPTAEAEFLENSSWSCAHGVGRWHQDCGCSVSQRPDWNQQWREPLRRAMDLLRERVDRIFWEHGRALFQNPWNARDAYIQVLLDRHESAGAFLQTHAKRALLPNEEVRALQLLEMQRNRMLMYTSCGWFFDDITGIETLQILRYAARVLQLAQPLDPALRGDFLAELALAQSNVRPKLRGHELFRQKIDPLVTDLGRVAAHAAMSWLFEDLPEKARVYCYDVRPIDSWREESWERTLLVGRITVASRITWERGDYSFAVIHLGGVDIRCSVAPLRTVAEYEQAKRDLLDTFRTQSSTELIRKLDTYFPGPYFSLKDLFVDQRRKIFDSLTESMYEEQAKVLESFYHKNKALAQTVLASEARVPDTFLTAAQFVLKRTFVKELQKLASGYFPEKLESVLAEKRFWNISLDLRAAEQLMGRRILSLLKELKQNPTDEDIPAEVIRLLDLGKSLEISLPLGDTQTLVFQIAHSLKAEGEEEIPPLVRKLADRLFVRISS